MDYLKKDDPPTLSRDEALGRLRERIVGFATFRMGREAAEDLAQETLLVLERRYRNVEREDEMVALAFQILRFQMAGWRRKTLRRGEPGAVAVDDLPLADPGASPETLAIRGEFKERLLAALAELGERCRTLLRLKLQDKSFDEIRRHFQVESINTIYTWDLRCRQQLRARLEAGGGTRP